MVKDLTDHEHKNIHQVKRVFTEVWNEKNTESIQSLFDPGYTAHYEHDIIEGLDRWFDQFYSPIVSAIPDFNLTFDDITAHHNTVVTRWKATGTHEFELFGVQPSGTRLDFSGISWSDLIDFRLTETWNSWSRRDFLQQLLNEVKELRELVPICCYCKKIRNDDGYWKQVEAYIQKHLDISLSHGICPDCFAKLEFP